MQFMNTLKKAYIKFKNKIAGIYLNVSLQQLKSIFFEGPFGIPFSF